MPLRRAKRIEELQAATQTYDLVLTGDAPLAQALNRRAPGAQLGHRAATPLTYARAGLDLPDKRRLFHTVIHETELPWKTGAHLLDLCLDHWEETGRLQGVLDHITTQRAAAEEIVDLLANHPSGHLARVEARIPEDLDVAVIGKEDLTGLDRTVLPDQADVIDPFTTDPWPFPELALMASQGAMVATLEDHLTRANAAETSLVLDPGSPLQPLVEAMLQAKGIPYQHEARLAEDAALRALVRALRLAPARNRLRGRDVRGLLASVGEFLPTRDDGKRLASLEHRAALGPLLTFWERAQGSSLGEALTAFTDWTDRRVPEARRLLEALALVDAPVNQATLDDLTFYLDTFEIKTDRTTQGVLLASPRSTAYVDRPRVFYLGLDTSWSEEVPTRPWTNRGFHERRSRSRFERLLQNGEQRAYLVQETRAGQVVTPCFHLHELLTGPDGPLERLERFTDLPHQRYAPRRLAPRAGFLAQPLGLPAPEVESLSASALDLLAYCPRDYYFSKVVREIDQDHFVRGNAFHDFAELYLSHPNILDEVGLEEITRVIMERLTPFLEEEGRPASETEVRIGLSNLAAYLDANPPRPATLEAYGDPPEERAGNRLAEALGLEVSHPLAERWFQAPGLGLHGKVDLIDGERRLIDHKSSKTKDSATTVVRKATGENGDHPPRHQPIAYLAHHRRAVGDERMYVTLLHFLYNIGDVLQGRAKLEDLTTTVVYHPMPFHAWLATEDAFTSLASSKDRTKVLEGLGYEAYRGFIETHDLPSFQEKEEAVTHESCEALLELCQEEVGDYKYVLNGVESLFATAVRLRRAMLFQEDLDAFEQRLAGHLADLSTYLATRFPVGEADLKRARHPDLLLAHLKGGHP
ncbi:MAG: PD-(D/E)XK nuclease family protein [Candidatus Thermoplasmatota archaeon]|nr:PD-(D/E)XK nuclease family protein [Candidatus Thermoplasmatota archaeon]